MADGQQAIGPLGAFQAETIGLGGVILVKKDTYSLLKFLNEDVVKRYAESRMMVGISDIKIRASGSVHASLIPDSWSKPADSADPSKGIGQCPHPCVTTLYQPDATPHMAHFLTPQLKPKVLVGEPPALLLWSSSDISVNVTFTLHLHGVGPLKWSNP
jgi:hypothetical protein